MASVSCNLSKEHQCICHLREMFLCRAHLVRVNPFNTSHLQLVYDGLTDRLGAPATWQQPLWKSTVVNMLYEVLCTVWLWWGLKLWSDTHCCHSFGFSEMPYAGRPPKVQGRKTIGLSGFSVTLKEDGVCGLAKGWLRPSSATLCKVPQVWLL